MSRRRRDDLGPAFEFEESWRRSLERRKPPGRYAGAWRWGAELAAILALGAVIAAALLVIGPGVR